MHVITLDGPGKNSLGTKLMSSLLAELRAHPGEPILLTGAGDAFSAGLNLIEVASLDPVGMRAFLELLDSVVAELYHHDAPTVAWVNGHAIAGGCVLALACDRRVGAPAARARIGLNEIALGLVFPPEILEIMTRQIRRESWTTVLLEAGLHSPHRALELGLLDSLGDLAAAEKALRALAQHPNHAFASAKRSLRPPTAPSDADRERFFGHAVQAWTSPELKARLLAVLER